MKHEKFPYIVSKAGLVGFLQGSIMGVVRSLESIPEDKNSYAIKSAVDTLKRVLSDSEEIWQKIKEQ